MEKIVFMDVGKYVDQTATASKSDPYKRHDDIPSCSG